MPYTVNIIYSASLDKFYIGFTGDEISIRLKKHNANHKGFTGRNADWIVKYIEEFDTKSLSTFWYQKNKFNVVSHIKFYRNIF